MYVALFPCNECAKVIIQSGITEVVFMSDKYATQPNMIASRRMFNMSKVQLRQFIPSRQTITVDFSGTPEATQLL
jgi:dCMP deaminase